MGHLPEALSLPHLSVSLSLPEPSSVHPAETGRARRPETVDSGFDEALLSASCSPGPERCRHSGTKFGSISFLVCVREKTKGLHLRCCDGGSSHLSPVLTAWITSPLMSHWAQACSWSIHVDSLYTEPQLTCASFRFPHCAGATFTWKALETLLQKKKFFKGDMSCPLSGSWSYFCVSIRIGLYVFNYAFGGFCPPFIMLCSIFVHEKVKKPRVHTYESHFLPQKTSPALPETTGLESVCVTM